jgi:hypothetical protein
MITLPELAAQDLGSFLASDTKDRFGSSHARLAELIPFAARLALDCIGNSDALYHNVEHTMLVTLAGHEIFKGRALLLPSTPADYSNFIVACLTHDIGYIRGIVKGDDAEEEIGLNRQLGYESPADLVDKYPKFYWDNVSPYIHTAIRYLNVTSSGRRWIASLYGNVFRAERELRLSGPQA